MFVSARYADSERAAIVTTDDRGAEWHLPADYTASDWLDYLAKGGAIDPYTPLAPTEADVIAERQRRLAEGFDFDFGDDRGIHHVGTTPEDLAGWDEVTKIASALLAVGQPDEPIAIVTATGPTVVTATEWQRVLLGAAAFRQPIFAASFTLQAMTPIPDDFADDRYWPA